MPSRADFYAGNEWLGSAAWDVYPSAVMEDEPQIFCAASEGAYRQAVASYLTQKGADATHPEQGWPWPWNNSDLSDNTYLFINGRTLVRDYSGPFIYYISGEVVDVDWTPPDMSEIKNVRWDQPGGAPMIGAAGPGGPTIIN